MQWHLDGWDPDGGRAFASLRPENLELLDQDETWGPMVFIGPPSFRPEPIANASIALASSRAAAFQPRTPLDGRELAFPNADAVADFVRRAFTSRGAPRGGEGGANLEGGPREPPLGGDGAAFDDNEFMVPWRAAQNRLAKDEASGAEPVQFLVPIAPTDKRGITWPSVESGAAQLVAALASAYPGVDHPDVFDRWYPSALNLHRAVETLGLWSSWKRGERVLDLGPGWAFKDVAETVLGRYGLAMSYLPPRRTSATYFLALLLNQYPAYPVGTKDINDEYLNYLLLISSGVAVVNPGESAFLDNRLDVLYSLPLPFYAQDETGLRSAGELLMTFVSSPGRFVKSQPRTLDLVSFGAALLAANTEDRTAEGWRERSAQNWLASSMPRWVFRDDAEQWIRGAVMVKQMANA